MADKEGGAFLESNGSVKVYYNTEFQGDVLNDEHLKNNESIKQAQKGCNANIAGDNSILEIFPTSTDGGVVTGYSEADPLLTDSEGGVNSSSSPRSDTDNRAPSSRESVISTADSQDDNAGMSPNRESFTKLTRELSLISMIGYPDEEEESRRLETLHSAITLQAEVATLRRLEFKRRQEALLNRKNKLSEKQHKNRNLPFPHTGGTTLGVTLRTECATLKSESFKQVHFTSEIPPHVRSRRKTAKF